MRAFHWAILVVAMAGLVALGVACQGDDGGDARISGEADDPDTVDCDQPYGVTGSVTMDSTKSDKVDMLVMGTDQCDQGVDLTSDDISIEESQDGETWYPVEATAEGLGVMSTSLTMDFSGSMDDYIDDLRRAVRAFVDQMDSDDEAQIVKFSSRVEIVQDFTNDKSTLHDVIDAGWEGAGGATALYESTATGLESVTEELFPRAVVAFTDGDDTMTAYEDVELELDTITHNATRSGVPVFTIGLGYVRAEILARIAEDTNGTFFNAPAEEELTRIYRQISDILRKAVRLNFTSRFTSGDVLVRVSINHVAGELTLTDQTIVEYTIE